MIRIAILVFLLLMFGAQLISTIGGAVVITLTALATMLWLVVKFWELACDQSN